MKQMLEKKKQNKEINQIQCLDQRQKNSWIMLQENDAKNTRVCETSQQLSETCLSGYTLNKDGFCLVTHANTSHSTKQKSFLTKDKT